MTVSTLFHLLPVEAVAPAQSQGWYEPPSFAQEGFIHCSFLHQLVPTANRHYGARSRLALLEIDPSPLADVRIENLSGGELFPHIYSRLPWSAVRQIHTIESGPDGQWMGQDSALALFDALDPVDLAVMMGRWRGYGFASGHPMDGLLEAVGWYGKAFVTADQVHPLLFAESSGEVYKISPSPWMMQAALQLSSQQLPLPPSAVLKPLFNLLSLPMRTEHSQARLRMMSHRGKVSATMIYDHLPIHDVFRRVDDNTLLGLMDYKASPSPFFFVLNRVPE